MSNRDNKHIAKEIFSGWPEWKKNFSATKHSAQKKEKSIVAGRERRQVRSKQV